MEECGICYLDYGPERAKRWLEACSHVVCSQCLMHLAALGCGWVKCPFCRALSPLPSNEEEEAEEEESAMEATMAAMAMAMAMEAVAQATVVEEESHVRGPFKWMKKLCRKTRAGPRCRGTLANEDLRDLERDLAIMHSYFMYFRRNRKVLGRLMSLGFCQRIQREFFPQYFFF